MLDSSLKSTLDQSSVVQCRWSLANFNPLSFIDLVSKGFLAGLRNSRRKSYCRRGDTVIAMTWLHFAANKPCTFFMELHGDLLTILFIRLLSLELVLFGTFRSFPVSKTAIQFKIFDSSLHCFAANTALFTAIPLRIFFTMWVTIFDRWAMLKEVFSDNISLNHCFHSILPLL